MENNLKNPAGKSYIEVCDEAYLKVDKSLKDLYDVLKKNNLDAKAEEILNIRTTLTNELYPAASKLRKPNNNNRQFRPERPKMENLQIDANADREDIKKAVDIASKNDKDVILTTAEAVRKEFAKKLSEGRATKEELKHIYESYQRIKKKKSQNKK